MIVIVPKPYSDYEGPYISRASCSDGRKESASAVKTVRESQASQNEKPAE